ncbi:hypothetical protein IFM89_012389 [Coptis chinensis]|uniref:Exostosin GT47 domain-containing protein n=1 Tax=Coptis chinensis TaxID=261450 RepID=A0A835M7S8_9MAGN|nr:hypothetical protein IFM89_012389 [Coptis chinensis]
MVRSSSLLHSFSNNSFSNSFRSIFFIPTTLALVTCLFILIYISSTSKLFFTHHTQLEHDLLLLKPSLGYSFNSSKTQQDIQSHHHKSSFYAPESTEVAGQSWNSLHNIGRKEDGIQEGKQPFNSNGVNVNEEVFHDEDIFLKDYNEMNRSFKIYVYPHKKDDPYAHALLPVDFEPGGNYASESYFKKALMQSHFITEEPAEADLFFLPFSIARLRHDKRVSVGGIPDFVRSYIFNISQKYPYWNRTGGTDHFYVACHSIGRSAMEKAEEVKFNAIQVVCSSSYFLPGYIAHKDASLPQIWPRHGDPPNVALSRRKNLAFFAGAINSPVRKKLLEVWKNDSEIYVHFGRLPTPYSDELLGSKFCLHLKGFEVNTARIGDALYYGCVPVIIANHYDLPFTDILNWKSFSLVVATLDIPLLKKILHRVSSEEYTVLQRNVLKVRKHFQWNLFPTDYDAFYMVMYELWLRRNSLRFSSSELLNFDQHYKTCLK